MDALDVAQQPFYTFGRVPTNDVQLDHPSSSRCGRALLGTLGSGVGWRVRSQAASLPPQPAPTHDATQHGA